MSVLLICFVRRGGMVHYTAQLANALVNITNVELIIPDCVDTAYFDSRIVLHRLPAGLSGRDTILKLLNPFFVASLWRLISRTQADVVHVPVTHPWNILVPLFVRRPILFTVHDPVHHSGESRYIQFIDKVMKRFSRAFFIHDINAVQALTEQVPQASLITVVPHGDYNLFARDKVADSPTKTFLFFGRIEEYKGIGTLLQAWPSVSQALPDWKLVIAGQGDLSVYDSQLTAPSITIYNRYISDQEVHQFFAESSIVVLPYHDATQSGVLMIAAAMARPVIASSVGAIPSIVADGQNGLLVPPRDSQALAQAMINLGQQPKTGQHMGQSLQATVAAQSSWTESATKHLQAYKQAIKS